MRNTLRAKIVNGTATVVVAGLVAACATAPNGPALRATLDIPAQAELTDVPFFAQVEYQCGPASLAMALAESGVSKDQCVVAPYPVFPGGLDSETPNSAPDSGNRPFHVLFAGTLQLRKGLPYLLEAKRRLGAAAIEFRLVGPSQLSETIMSELAREMEVVGPVIRSEMAQHYRWADAFVLPTLSEGSANVCYEAMANGLPVITTPNAGSIIRDGEDGLLVPVRNAELIAESIAALHKDRERREQLGGRARASLQRLTLQSYADRLKGLATA